MSRELSSLYQSLAEDADVRELPSPGTLRHRADRRARARIAMTALATIAVVAGTAIGAESVLTSNNETSEPPVAGVPPVTATPSPRITTPVPVESTASPKPGRPSVTPSKATGSAEPTTPRTIPDRAFFTQPPETVAAPPRFVPEKPLPELCGARYPSDGSLVQRRARKLYYRGPETPEGWVPDGSCLQTISIYEAGRAKAWMTELRRAVRGCREQKINGVVHRQRLLSSGDYGDESVLLEISSPMRDVEGVPTGGEEIHLIRAIRIGAVVTVLWEQGWEGTSSERAQVDDYSRRAVTAIRRWLG